MKARRKHFLAKTFETENQVGDYIRELHLYLWRFIRAELGYSASGNLDDYIDIAISKAEEGAKKMNGFEKWEIVNECIPRLALPTHIDLGTNCCGFFSDLRPDGLYCNECGMNITDAIQGLYNTIKAMAYTISDERKGNCYDTDSETDEKEILNDYLKHYCKRGYKK